MRNPFLKYLFTCKHCGEESPSQLSAYNKMKLQDIHGKPQAAQRCMKCGHQTEYHFDRLYAKMQIWPIVLLWLVGIATSYFWGMHMYEKFGMGGEYMDKKIEAIVGAFIAPLAACGFIVVRLWKMDNRFNLPMRDQY